MRDLQGKLLVASPTLLDPNFARTVIAIANHDEDGALGIVLNRPSDTEVAEAVPDLAEVVEADEVVFVGGPVQPASIVVLAQFADPGQAAYLVTGDVGLVGDATGLDHLDEVTERRRIFAGYAGWGPGQLEAELAAGAWVVADFRLDDAFAVEPTELWRTVLRRQPGRVAWLANYPDDPSVN